MVDSITVNSVLRAVYV